MRLGVEERIPVEVWNKLPLLMGNFLHLQARSLFSQLSFVEWNSLSGVTTQCVMRNSSANAAVDHLFNTSLHPEVVHSASERTLRSCSAQLLQPDPIVAIPGRHV